MEFWITGWGESVGIRNLELDAGFWKLEIGNLELGNNYESFNYLSAVGTVNYELRVIAYSQ